MREFRAWDRKNEVMVYPKGILFDGRIVNFNCGMLESYEGYELIQFTGLYDKNGKKVYEGDLLKHPTGVVAEIKYENDVASFVAVYTANDDIEMNHLDKEIISKCEVVGNIYENPELLEGKK